MHSSRIPSRFRPINGESYADVKKRLRPFMSKLYRRHPNDTVLVSTHGITIRCIMSIYMKVSLEEATRFNARNAGVLIFEIRGSGARLVEDDMTVAMAPVVPKKI